MTLISAPTARAPYDCLASIYDLLTAGYGHDRWLAEIERLARTHGLRGKRLLDVACGTGSSFLPLLHAGYRVTACDLSPEMARRARQKSQGRATVLVADMRRLTVRGHFDLITCLDDAINHLAAGEEVVDALAGMRSNLDPRGVLVFDVNTLAAYRSPPDVVVADEDRFVAWRGALAGIDHAGGAAEVVIDVFERRQDEQWTHDVARQPHRHYPVSDVHDFVREAGLRVLAVYGQRPGAVLDAHVDEHVHHKALFFAAAA